MGKVLNLIKNQIKRQGETPENLKVLKLYNLLVKHKLTSAMLWQNLVSYEFERFGSRSFELHTNYSVKPAFLALLEDWNADQNESEKDK